ncbi:MAG: hypothetical protein AB7U99_02980 [Steroidobacteraceae bacterium]
MCKKKLVMSVLLCLSVNSIVSAQVERSGNDTTRIVQQLQQVTAEKGKLQQDNDALKKELDTLKSNSAQPSAEQIKLQQRLRELEMANSRSQEKVSNSDEQLEKTRTQMTELIGKYRELAQSLKDVETERDGLRASEVAKQRELTTCVDRNAQMYLLGNELLDQMDVQSVWSAVKSKEPFTQLSRTHLENLIDDYRYRVNELKLEIKAASTPTP